MAQSTVWNPAALSGGAPQMRGIQVTGLHSCRRIFQMLLACSPPRMPSSCDTLPAAHRLKRRHSAGCTLRAAPLPPAHECVPVKPVSLFSSCSCFCALAAASLAGLPWPAPVRAGWLCPSRALRDSRHPGDAARGSCLPATGVACVPAARGSRGIWGRPALLCAPGTAGSAPEARAVSPASCLPWAACRLPQETFQLP